MDSKNVVIEEAELTDNLKLSTSVSFNQEKIFLDVSYMKGKYTLQRAFRNNYIGLEQLQMAKDQFSDEGNVKKYFNLGDL